MPAWLIVLLCAIAAVAFFVVGMSLTLMIKGHHIDSEISTNKEMQRLGIKCAVQETRPRGRRLFRKLRRLRHRTQDDPAGLTSDIPSNKKSRSVSEDRDGSFQIPSAADVRHRTPPARTDQNGQNLDRQWNHGLCRSSSL